MSRSNSGGLLPPMARRLQRRLSLIVCRALLGACVAGPDYTAPAIPTGKVYDTAPSAAEPRQPAVDLVSAAPLQWWTLLECPRLNDLMDLALGANHDLAAAEATLNEARLFADVAGAARFPQVDLSVQSGRQKYGAEFLGPQKVSPFSLFSLGTDITYSLDLAGGTRRNIERQQALIQVQKARVDNTYLTLSGNVALQALAIAATRAQIKTVEELIADDRQNLDLVNTALEARSVSDLDQLNAQVQLDADLTLLPPLRRRLAAARHALAVLVGQSSAD